MSMSAHGELNMDGSGDKIETHDENNSICSSSYNLRVSTSERELKRA